MINLGIIVLLSQNQKDRRRRLKIPFWYIISKIGESEGYPLTHPQKVENHMITPRDIVEHQ